MLLPHEHALDAFVRQIGGATGHHSADIPVQVHDSALTPDHILAALDDDVPDQGGDAGLGIVDPKIAAADIGAVGDDDMPLRINPADL